MELYARVLTETEKPLFIEKLWSPKDGYSWFLELAEIKELTLFFTKICVFKLAFHVRRFELRKSLIQQQQQQHQGHHTLQQQQVNINMTAEAMQRQAADVNNNMTANVSDTTTVSTTSGLLQLDTKIKKEKNEYSKKIDFFE